MDEACGLSLLSRWLVGRRSTRTTERGRTPLGWLSPFRLECTALRVCVFAVASLLIFETQASRRLPLFGVALTSVDRNGRIQLQLLVLVRGQCKFRVRGGE